MGTTWVVRLQTATRFVLNTAAAIAQAFLSVSSAPPLGPKKAKNDL